MIRLYFRSATFFWKAGTVSTMNNLGISLSTVYNLKKKKSENLKKSLGRGWKPILKICDLLSPKGKCIKTGSSVKISLQNHIVDSGTLPKTTVCDGQFIADPRMQAGYKSDPESLGSFKMDWGKVKSCPGVLEVRIWNLFWKSMMPHPLGFKRRGTIWLLVSAEFKIKHLWRYGNASVHITSWVTCTFMKAPFTLKNVYRF